MCKRYVVAMVAWLVVAGGTVTLLGRADLGISPVYQRTPVWCWAAVGEMVFEHFGVENINPAGNYQCGILALLHPICNQNCLNCVVPAASLATMNNMLTQYPRVAGQVTRTSTTIATRVSSQRLSLSMLQSELDAGRPVVAGISPSGYKVSGISEHVALIVGYDGADLIVNDPFPFRAAFAHDPYRIAGGDENEPGQYSIPYNAFVTRLNWRESIYDIRCRGIDCRRTGGGGRISSDRGDHDSPPPPPRMGRSCQTSVGRCGPFYNQPALPVGASCWCGTSYGPVAGQVVQ